MVACIGVIAVISRILVEKDEQIIVETNNITHEKASLVQDYDFKIGMSMLDTSNYLKSKNIVLNELVKVSYKTLVQVDKKYNIKYNVAKQIDKINNKEYIIELNEKLDITSEDVINSVNKLKEIGKESIYYSTIYNIANISKLEKNKVKIELNKENSYFVYELDFPLVGVVDDNDYKVNEVENGILLSRDKSKSTLNTIKFTGYNDSDNMINDFRNNNLDMFTASSDGVMQLIGRHDYNVKKYRDGETIFLFGNKDSKLFSRKEVRLALVYSLNRDEIVKEINSSFAEVIDIPYIYSDIKMKYDLYGAQNALLSQGWQKSSNTYIKKMDKDNIKLELNLLVNESDEVKVKIAEKIKQMAEKNGIIINVNKQKDEALKNYINDKNYDIILADVYINNVPNIDFIEEHININGEINSAINIVNESSVEDLPKNIENLQNLLSSEVACIGILARNTSIVYQKNITGFNDIGYMKMFGNIDKIGKIQEIKKDIE